MMDDKDDRVTDAPTFSDEEPVYSVEVELEDLVMLQMTGEIDTYLEELDNDPDEVIASAREEAVTSEVFGNILDNTVNSQFSDSYAFLRELAQNGKDAYETRENRVVRFSHDRTVNGDRLTAKDHGSGMTIEGVIQNMLVPFNSAKDLDMDSIGEHGIGWYSVLEPAETVQVTTGTGDERIEATIKQQDEAWVADIDVHDDTYNGTEVTIDAAGRLDADRVYDRLRKHVGHVDPDTATITLDGTPINTEREAYEKVGEGEVRANGTLGTVELYATEGYSPGALVTQDGLFIKNDPSPFRISSIHKEIFSDLQDAENEFWFELPNNVGLTKGRDAVVSSDRYRVRDGMEEALESYVLEYVLEEEYSADKLDMKVSDWIDDMMEDAYKGATYWSILEGGPVAAASGLLYIGSQKVKETVKELQELGVDSLQFSPPNTEAMEYNRDREDRAAAYLDEMDEFSERIFEKSFIPATEYDGEETVERQVAIKDLVVAHVEDELHVGYEADEEGVWIEPDNEPARRVRRKLTELDEESEVKADDDTSLRSSLGDLYASAKSFVPSIDVDWDAPDALQRTNTYTVERVIEAEDQGQEYMNLLRAVEKMDEAVAAANDVSASSVHIHYDEEASAGSGMERAHQAGTGISFNLAESGVEEHVEDMRSGEMSEETYMQLLDTVLHEKAHYVRGNDRATATHGREFYEEDKRELRDNLLAEQYDSEQDLYDAINEELEDVSPDRAVEPEAFGDLVDSHASYLDPVRAKLR